MSELNLKNDASFYLNQFTIRQERITVDHLNVYLQCDGEKYEVADCTPFSIAIYASHKFVDGYKSENAVFGLDGLPTQLISIQKIRQEKLPKSNYKVVFEIRNSPLDLVRIAAADMATQTLKRLQENRQNRVSIPSSFRALTLEIQEVLSDFKLATTSLQEELKFTSQQDERSAQSTVVALGSQYLGQTLEPLFTRLADSLNGEKIEIILKSYEYFRQVVGNFLDMAPFSQRSLSKPLGYAGDYEMMNMIYRNELLGHSLFSKTLHSYMVNMSGGKAVRNRSSFLATKITQTIASSALNKNRCKILSVASGPAREIQLMIENESKKPNLGALAQIDNIEFHLFDQDIDSLRYAQKKLKVLSMQYGLSLNLSLKQLNVRNIIGKGVEPGEYDLIYSAGLFDYFSDPLAVRVAEALYSGLKSGGRLIIGNFDVSNPSRFFMELAWDWMLIYRSKEYLTSLFSGISDNSLVESEAEKVNLFFTAVKT